MDINKHCIELIRGQPKIKISLSAKTESRTESGGRLFESKVVLSAENESESGSYPAPKQYIVKKQQLHADMAAAASPRQLKWGTGI